MSNFSRLIQVTLEVRVATFYFFSAMSVGAVNGFAGIWFASIGILPEQIGIITAAPVVVVLLFGFYVGRLADLSSDWRHTIVIGAVLSGLAPIILFFVDGFWSVCLVWTLCVTAQMATLPILDAAAIRMTRRRGSDFSVFYAWKTVGYLLMIFFSGVLITRFGVPFFLPLFVGLSALRGVMAFSLPKFRESRIVPMVAKPKPSMRAVIKPWFILPLLAWSLVHCTHFVQNGFLGLLWTQQGLPASTIGLLIAASSVAETAMFLYFKRFSSKFRPEHLILISALAGVARWGALAYSPGIELLFPLQLLHAFTYAIGFLACTNLIADKTSEEIAAQAQSFFTVMQLGIAIPVLVGFGWLAGAFGAKAFLASSGLAGIGATILILSLALEKREPVRRNGPAP